MTISIWRFSHLALAVSSFLFIALASITGLILAFEPVSDILQPHAIQNLERITLAETIANARKEYDEVIEIKIVKNRFVEAGVITKDGRSLNVYLDPESGKNLGEIQEKSAFFEFVTTLHRSLFLHGLGRFFMGLSAFLLFLIACTGSILVVKRQRHLSKFFSKVVRESRFQFYHVVFGRIWLIPILIVSLSGLLIALDDFELLETRNSEASIDFEKVRTEPKIEASEFEVFAKTPLSKVESVEFPFSDDKEDAFTVTLSDRKRIVNQFTGDILFEEAFPSARKLLGLGLDLHTGRANAIWAIVLAIASINILFFIYSGFSMTLKRRSARIRNTFAPGDAEFIVLAGSENGSTMHFAKEMHTSLIKAGQASYFAELNHYESYASARHILVMTATYGNGEAPANARKALSLMEKHGQNHEVRFSVLGFGSHAYPDFCRFAYDVYNTLSLQPNLEPFLEIRTVNDKSIASFSEWVGEWANKAGIPLRLDLQSAAAKPKKLRKFKVIAKSEAEMGGAFLVTLEPKKKHDFRSGDLLNVYPANDHRERQYSIGKVANRIQLSVKRHESGLGSAFLYELGVGQTIEGRIVPNPEFHFDRAAGRTIMISNGTGIGPFLGMIDENEARYECHLYCGFRDERAFAPYGAFVASQLEKGKLARVQTAYSRTAIPQYVNSLLEKDSEFIASVLQNGGNIMLCGSLAMQKDVLELVTEICENRLGKTLGHYQAVGQIKMDCY